MGPLNEVEKRNCPAKLFLAGDPSLLKNGKRVSLVGSREATERGLEAASKLAALLARNDIIVVSGLAKGIDTASHRGSIAAKGRTIAVIGTPLEEYYPKENRDLQTEIADSHLLISQFPPGYPSNKSNFPMRNRTMALISDATVIVEAGESSGTLHQGWEALRLGRPLWIMESTANNAKLSWPKEMIKYGARVLGQNTLAELLETLPSSTRDERSQLTI